MTPAAGTTPPGPAGEGREHRGTDPLAVVDEHLDAFEQRDLERVLATFADDATFSTAEGTVVGRRALRQLFDQSFRLPARVEMERRATHVAGETVVCELAEHITAEGMTHTIDVATVYTVRRGLVVRVRVYRDLSG